jgi:hypothetical protein
MPRRPKDGGFVFEPRAVVKLPGAFGKSSTPLEPEGVPDARFQAAQLQHVVANTVRECLLARRLSLKKFVAESSLPGWSSYDRLSRIQRGETMMMLADLQMWAEVFDEVRMTIEGSFRVPLPAVAETGGREMPTPEL